MGNKVDDKELFKGYGPETVTVFRKFNVKVWSDVEIKATTGEFKGVILPRSEQAPDGYIVLKMDTGYNIGIAAKKIVEMNQTGIPFVDANMREMNQTGFREGKYKIPEKEFPTSANKPNVVLLGTGGTIASRLDYRTGAVIPAFSPGELYGAVPELADICNLNTKKIFGIFSEDMSAVQWKAIATAIDEEIKNGADGIVIGHGTDTMHYTSAALTYMCQDLPVPVVIVGSQRSSDRPSSDAARNLIHAVKAASESDLAEVMVCMFGPTSDEYGLIHRGTRVRKMHSSYRSTFRTIGDIPLAMISEDWIKPLQKDYKRRDMDRKLKLTPAFEDKVSILYYYPNMNPDLVDSLRDNGYKGLIIAGTGLGHVNRKLNPALKRAIDGGMHVYMTVQTLWGFVQMYVYDTGRDLLELGVVPCANMIPETAYMKLGWALGQTDDPEEVRKIMLNPVCHDITEGEPSNGYLIFQGGIPEVEEFLHNIRF